MISDVILGAIIAGVFGFLGVALGTILSIWTENRKARREYIQSLRLRLTGDFAQTSELMLFIESQRHKRWLHFWQKGYADLSHAQLAGVDFRKKDLRNIIFYQANLQGANFYQANLQGCDFTSANISNADFFLSNIRGANFFKTNLENVKLDEVDLTGATLIACSLENASLKQTQLIGADLRVTSFKGADLTGANLQGANLAKANFEGANISAADFTGAIYNKETIWAQGFDLQKNKVEFLEQSGSKRAMEKLGRKVTNLSIYKK